MARHAPSPPPLQMHYDRAAGTGSTLTPAPASSSSSSSSSSSTEDSEASKSLLPPPPVGTRTGSNSCCGRAAMPTRSCASYVRPGGQCAAGAWARASSTVRTAGAAPPPPPAAPPGCGMDGDRDAVSPRLGRRRADAVLWRTLAKRAEARWRVAATSLEPAPPEPLLRLLLRDAISLRNWMLSMAKSCSSLLCGPAASVPLHTQTHTQTQTHTGTVPRTTRRRRCRGEGRSGRPRPCGA
jgi:hypothetical protein